MLPRSALKPRRQNAPRPAEKVAHGYLKWLRGRPCSLADSGQCSPLAKVEAAHVDHAGGKGVGTKVADRHAIPLCGATGHHFEQHCIGWRSFEQKYDFDAVKLAEAYWQAWPGRAAWMRKQEQ